MAGWCEEQDLAVLLAVGKRRYDCRTKEGDCGYPIVIVSCEEQGLAALLEESRERIAEVVKMKARRISLHVTGSLLTKTCRLLCTL